MDADAHSHKHVLWSLNYLISGFKKIGPFKRSEAEVVVVEVSLVVDFTLDSLAISLDNLVDILCKERCRPSDVVLVVSKNGGDL
jgi:hypothetical protein